MSSSETETKTKAKTRPMVITKDNDSGDSSDRRDDLTAAKVQFKPVFAEFAPTHQLHSATALWSIQRSPPLSTVEYDWKICNAAIVDIKGELVVAINLAKPPSQKAMRLHNFQSLNSTRLVKLARESTEDAWLPVIGKDMSKSMATMMEDTYRKWHRTLIA